MIIVFIIVALNVVAARNCGTAIFGKGWTSVSYAEGDEKGSIRPAQHEPQLPTICHRSLHFLTHESFLSSFPAAGWLSLITRPQKSINCFPLDGASKHISATLTFHHWSGLKFRLYNLPQAGDGEEWVFGHQKKKPLEVTSAENQNSVLFLNSVFK